jgi:DNA repair exonuclease SbcCD ATPase subunit
MKLQIDQIESFDTWISQAEHRISTQLEIMQEDLSGVDRQYRQLAQLQDELVAQQQITESLQNMVIVIDDSSNNGMDTAGSKYTSTEIEVKLLNLSQRWENICAFVQSRWVQLQEVKIELEQFEFNQEKVQRWLTRKEEEITKILAETNLTDTDTLMQQVHSIKVIPTFCGLLSSDISLHKLFYFLEN